MKKIACSALLLSIAFAFWNCDAEKQTSALENQNLEKDSGEIQMVGAYSKLRALSSEDSLVFQKAMQDSANLQLKPLKVSTQVVAGTNYLFYCENLKDAERKTLKVKIFEPLPGQGDPQIVSIEE